jgi:hypothetical protein
MEGRRDKGTTLSGALDGPLVTNFGVTQIFLKTKQRCPMELLADIWRDADDVLLQLFK